MNDRDKATLKLLLGQCCCPDETPPKPQRPQRPAVHGRPMTPRAPQVDEDTPFVLSRPSYGTGQRPSDFGTPHVPATSPDGAPQAEVIGPTLTGADTVVLDSGELRPLDLPALVDHQQRLLRFTPRVLGDGLTRVQAPGDLLTVDARWWEYALNLGGVWTVTPDPYATTLSEVRLTTTATVNLTLAYDGTETSDPWQVTQVNPARPLRFVRLGVPGDAHRLRVRRVRLTSDDPDAPPRTPLWWAVEVRVDGEWYAISVNDGWEPPVNQNPTTSDEAWPFALGELAALPAEDPITPNPTSAVSAALTFAFTTSDFLPVEPPGPTGPRWLSPDGRIRIDGPATRDQATLSAEDTLTAGDTVSIPGPGSWAAYRGAQGQAVLLVEADGQMTRVDVPPDGPPVAQSVPLAAWLAGLGIPVGAWAGFARSGPLFSNWPPHEALTRDPELIET